MHITEDLTWTTNTKSISKNAQPPTLFSAGWKEQASLHPSSPPSTGVPLRACWPAASLSGTETAVQQTARPSSAQWTPLQKSLVPLSPPSWTFSLHDAPAKQKVSWRTPPTPPTVSSSSYPQVDGYRSIRARSAQTAQKLFPPGCESPELTSHSPLSETPNNPPPSLKPQKTVKLLSLWNSGERACTSHCSNTSPLHALDTFTHHCVSIIHKRLIVIYDCNVCMVYWLMHHNHLHCSPASCLNVSLLNMYSILKSSAQLYSFVFFVQFVFFVSCF